MTYYGAKELAASFRTVRKNTITIAEEIPEDNYAWAAAPGGRTVAQTLTHIATACRFQQQVQFEEHRSTMEGFDFFAFHAPIQAEEQKPRSKQEIIDFLHEEGDKFAAQLEGCSDEFLAEQVSAPAMMQMPPRSRFEMLLSVKEHEMHHRGQLMIVERQIGITPHLTRQMQERIAAMQAAQSAKV